MQQQQPHRRHETLGKPAREGPVDRMRADVSFLAERGSNARKYAYSNRQVQSALARGDTPRAALVPTRLADRTVPGQHDTVWRSFNQGVRGIVLVPSSVTYAGTVPVQVTWPVRYDPELPFMAAYKAPALLQDALGSDDYGGGGSSSSSNVEGVADAPLHDYIASVLLSSHDALGPLAHPNQVSQRRMNNVLYDLERRCIEHLTLYGTYLESRLDTARTGLLYFRVPRTQNPAIKATAAQFMAEQTRKDSLTIFMTATQQLMNVRVREVRIRADSAAGICLCDSIHASSDKMDPAVIEEYMQSLSKKIQLTPSFDNL